MSASATTTKPTYVTQSTVLDREGWTKKAVEKFLGEPDKEVPNPRYSRAGAPMRLYDLARVEGVETTPEWADWLEASARRRAAAAQSAKKRKASKEAADAAWVQTELDAYGPFSVPEMPLKVLWRQAVASWRERNPLEPKPHGVDEATRQRWMVNFLRHECSEYDDWMDYAESLPGQRGVLLAERVRDLVLDAIAETYPSLSAECKRQRWIDDGLPWR